MAESVKPSPWSTPRKSEYGEGFIVLKEEDDEDEEEGGQQRDAAAAAAAAVADEEDTVLKVEQELVVREMGDGEPSKEEERESVAIVSKHHEEAQPSKSNFSNQEPKTEVNHRDGTSRQQPQQHRRQGSRRGRRQLSRDVESLDFEDSGLRRPPPSRRETESRASEAQSSSPKKKGVVDNGAGGGGGRGSFRRKPRPSQQTKVDEETKSRHRQQQQQESAVGPSLRRRESGEGQSAANSTSSSTAVPPATKRPSAAKDRSPARRAEDGPKGGQKSHAGSNHHEDRRGSKNGLATATTKGDTGGSIGMAHGHGGRKTVTPPSSKNSSATNGEQDKIGVEECNEAPIPSTQTSPRKRKRTARARGRDIIELPRPYNLITSDDVKRWEAELKENGTVDEEAEGNEMVAEMSFTNALVLKINQLSKQGLLSKLMIFSFACHLSNYDIKEEDRPRCARSFFMFARQLTAIRDGIDDNEQKQEFDLEAASWIPPVYAKVEEEKSSSRPPTAKPRNPDEYVFADENIANDYRKLWEGYQALLAQQQQRQEGEETPGGAGVQPAAREATEDPPSTSPAKEAKGEGKGSPRKNRRTKGSKSTDVVVNGEDDETAARGQQQQKNSPKKKRPLQQQPQTRRRQ